MWSLFSTSSNTAGFRLQYMEVYNWGTFDNEIFKMQMEEETAIDFGQPDQLKSASFKLITTNGMPFGAQVQFYFCSSYCRYKLYS